MAGLLHKIYLFCFTLFNRTIGVFPMVSVTSFAHEGAAATGAALNARTLDTVRTARRVKVLMDMLLVYFLPPTTKIYKID